MKKKLIGIFVCMLMVATVLPVSGDVDVKSNLISPSSGNTLYVGGSGPGNYSKIQDAINDSSNGDTVFVYDDSSPYYERVQINTSISLIGEDRNTTVIDAEEKEDTILISSNNVSICEFTIQNSSNAGVEIDWYFGFCNISDNIVQDNIRGITFIHSDKNIIADNTFFDNEDYSIDGYYINNNVIMGNTIDHPPGTYNFNGIALGRSIGNNISGNTIKNCDDGVLLHDSDNNIISNNVISSNYMNGIRISEGSNNWIIGNNISYNEYWGIEIREDSIDNIIYHNNIEYNYENAVDEGNNTWDDGKYGNYWSDYEDKYPDAKKKKWKYIWDTPYEIPNETRGNNYDNCPLIKQWPESVSKPLQYNEYVWFYRWLERFPIFKMILETLNGFYNNMKGGIWK